MRKEIEEMGCKLWLLTAANKGKNAFLEENAAASVF